MTESYFSHEPKIKTHEQMMETLKSRTSSAVSRSEKSLRWLAPIRNQDGSGHQTAEGTLYVIRKTLSKDHWMYWAWHDKKLLGYSENIEIARTHCQTHALNQP